MLPNEYMTRMAQFNSQAALACTGVLLVFIWTSCTASIRNFSQIQKDPYFVWQNTEHKDMDTRLVLEKTATVAGNDASNDRALAYIHSGELDKAERILIDILAQKNDYLPAYLNLSRLYALLNEGSRLTSIHKRMTLEKKISSKRLFDLASSFEGQNRTSESTSLMQQLAMNKKSIDALFWLAALHYENQDYKRLIESYESILDVDDRNADALNGLAIIYYQGENWELAFHYFEKVQKIEPSIKELNFHLSNCQNKMGNVDLALEYLKNIPANQKSLQALELHGHLLLQQNYASNLDNLLNEAKSDEDKKKLRNSWFGGQDMILRRDVILPEFKNMN